MWISRVPEALALPNFVVAFEIVCIDPQLCLSGATSGSSIARVYIKQLAYTRFGIRTELSPWCKAFRNTSHYKHYFKAAVYAECYFSKEKILDEKILMNQW